jgi:hypothetical protein
MSAAVAQLHGALGIVLFVLLTVAAVVTLVSLVRRRDAPFLPTARRILLGLVVAQAAIGLALAARGAAPAEGIHWLYGVAVIVVLLAPSSLEPASAGARRAVLVAGTLLAAVFAWRLWGSG